MSKLALGLFAATAALALANGAFAGSRAASRVYYRDLDLSTARGAQLMLKRINVAVVELCAPSHSPVILPPQRPADNARCKVEATERAVASLHASAVTAEYVRTHAPASLVAARN